MEKKEAITVFYDEETKINERKRIGMRIAALRRQRGISINELARISGVFRTVIGRIENGKVSGEFDTLQKIATALESYVTLLEKNK